MIMVVTMKRMEIVNIVMIRMVVVTMMIMMYQSSILLFPYVVKILVAVAVPPPLLLLPLYPPLIVAEKDLSSPQTLHYGVGDHFSGKTPKNLVFLEHHFSVNFLWAWL